MEWTFKYDSSSRTDGTPYNTTYFETIGGISYAQWKGAEITNDRLMARVAEKFDSWIHTLLEIKSNLRAGGSDKKTEIECEGIDFIVL